MNKRGVTLVDSLVAAAIMLILISFFAQIMAVAKKELTASEKKLIALYEARSLMERVRATPFASLPGLQGEKIKVVPIGADAYIVDVSVSWSANRQPVKLCTMRFNQ